MDTQPDMNASQTTLETMDFTQDGALEEPISPEVEETFSKFLHFWDLLVSTTNWEKGKIIHEWRESLRSLGAPVAVYSDDAWSRRAGNVSPQHVGRLRRVHERFGEVHGDYPSLYWSHFQAALDWNDAEMWLEGAVQNDWSVAKMREQRWQAQGAPEKEKPRAEDVIVAEFDEDVSDTDDGKSNRDHEGEYGDAGSGGAEDWSPDGEVGDPEDHLDVSDSSSAFDAGDDFGSAPFDELPPLPGDLAEAMEAFKLAIIHHKLDGWKEITCGQVLQVLEGLRQVALSSRE